MIQLPEEFDSIFRYIVVVSQRAEQLINGAKVRTESRHAKPTLKARDDVDGKAVDWRVLTQEELATLLERSVDAVSRGSLCQSVITPPAPSMIGTRAR